MGFFNQYSYPLIAVMVGIIMFIGLRASPQIPLPIVIIAMAGYAIFALFVSLQFRYPDSPIVAETVVDVESTLANGQPTFVMLYSNY